MKNLDDIVLAMREERERLRKVLRALAARTCSQNCAITAQNALEDEKRRKEAALKEAAKEALLSQFPFVAAAVGSISVYDKGIVRVEAGDIIELVCGELVINGETTGMSPAEPVTYIPSPREPR